MIYNVIDRRKHKFRWKQVDVALEPTHHDNSCDNADIAPKGDGEGIGYDDLVHVSLPEAIKWASETPYPATLYVYDAGALTRHQRLSRTSL